MEIVNRNFIKDFEYSNNLNIRNEWERVLKKVFGDNILIDFKDAKNIQLEIGTDTTIKLKNGRRLSIELKTKRYSLMPHNNWVLEIKHHRYLNNNRTKLINSTDGWLYTSTSEYIFYGTLNQKGDKIIEVCGFSLAPFKYDDFKSEISKLAKRFAYTEFNNCYQTTIIVLASTEFLKNNAYKFWYFKDEQL
jgi:hypothetical protein